MFYIFFRQKLHIALLFCQYTENRFKKFNEDADETLYTEPLICIINEYEKCSISRSLRPN